VFAASRAQQEPKPRHVAVKEVVLPFNKFPGADTLLGPEMRSTGEVMGIDYDFASSYAKAQIAAGQKLPMSGGCAVLDCLLECMQWCCCCCL
jgi:carbamoylphosphate synthase large subunit